MNTICTVKVFAILALRARRLIRAEIAIGFASLGKKMHIQGTSSPLPVPWAMVENDAVAALKTRAHTHTHTRCDRSSYKMVNEEPTA